VENKIDGDKIGLSSDILKGMKLDLFLSLLLVAIFTIAFMAAGTVILGGKHLLPNGVDLISAQQNIYNTINPIMGSYISNSYTYSNQWYTICWYGCST